MKAFSIDLRERVLAAKLSGKTVNQVARAFNVSAATVNKYDRQARKTGDLEPRKYPPRLNAARNNPKVHTAVRAFLSENNDATLAECCAVVAKQCEVEMSVAGMCRLLTDLGLKRKKNGSCNRARYAGGTRSTRTLSN
jgi:transposase